MQAIILAGGLGTRLGSLTKNTPKPIVSVCNKPYLYYQLTYLKRFQIHNILILTGYLGEQIQNEFKDGRALDLNISYSHEKEPLGTGGALIFAQEKIENQFLLINGDSFLPIDYMDFITTFKESQKSGLLCVYQNQKDKVIVPSNISLEPTNQIITDYCKKTRDEHMQHVDAGVGLFEKKVLNLINDQEKFSFENDIYPLLIKDKQLKAYPTQQRFYDIGTPQRLKEFVEYLKNDYLKDTI